MENCSLCVGPCTLHKVRVRKLAQANQHNTLVHWGGAVLKWSRAGARHSSIVALLVGGNVGRHWSEHVVRESQHRILSRRHADALPNIPNTKRRNVLGGLLRGRHHSAGGGEMGRFEEVIDLSPETSPPRLLVVRKGKRGCTEVLRGSGGKRGCVGRLLHEFLGVSYVIAGSFGAKHFNGNLTMVFGCGCFKLTALEERLMQAATVRSKGLFLLSQPLLVLMRIVDVVA